MKNIQASLLNMLPKTTSAHQNRPARTANDWLPPIQATLSGIGTLITIQCIQSLRMEFVFPVMQSYPKTAIGDNAISRMGILHQAYSPNTVCNCSISLQAHQTRNKAAVTPNLFSTLCFRPIRTNLAPPVATNISEPQ